MANKVDPDGTAHDEPSHQDLHCLQKRLIIKHYRNLVIRDWSQSIPGMSVLLTQRKGLW